MHNNHQDNHDNHHDIEITAYDRVLMAWETSKELTRDYQMYADTLKDTDAIEIFREFAEDEGYHASKLKDLLDSYNKTK